MKTNDRRVKKTKKALYMALGELLLTKKIQQVTVRELANKAEVHRATFYSHYQDIYDLYEQMENEVMEDLETIIANGVLTNEEEIFSKIIDYIEEQANICRIFLNEDGQSSLNKKMSCFLEEKYKEIWQSELKKEALTEEQKIWLRYHIKGLLAILNYWSEQDFTIPKENILAIILKIDHSFDLLKLD